MILRSNLPKLREVGGRSARVLDAGGWYRPFNLATHVTYASLWISASPASSPKRSATALR
jgi:hypothetical protein